MQVILNTEIIGLGEEGDIIEVSPGYARNFLFPQKKAQKKNAQNLSILESKRSAIAKRKEERKIAQMGIKERLEAEQLVIAMNVGEKGHLFGSVTSSLVTDELEKKGITVLKKSVIIPSGSIKEVGNYTIDVKLYHGVTAQLKIIVEDKHKKDQDATPTITDPKTESSSTPSKELASVEVEKNTNTEESPQDLPPSDAPLDIGEGKAEISEDVSKPLDSV